MRRAFERLERHAGKLARAVLRGRGGGNAVLLPDLTESLAPRRQTSLDRFIRIIYYVK